MDQIDVVAPENEEGTKATVLRWCKATGDAVRKDEPLLELETDKVTVEIPSPVTGKLTEILKQPNEEVVPGQILARVRIAEGSEAGAAPRQAPRPTAPAAAQSSAAQEGGQPLSPAVRRLLNEHALTAQDLKGSGRDGRITVQDVERHIDQKTLEAPAADDADTTAKMRRPTGLAAAEADDARRDDARRGDARRIPHGAVRRRVAEHMARSLAQAPHVTTVFEADLTHVQAHRARHTAEYERQGIRLTLTAYFVAACARALLAHPALNATFHEDALELHPDANIGVGTALGNEGLIVPVIHRAQHMSLAQLAARLGQLVGAARAGRLGPQEVRGGTFTISNHGVGGSLLAAPIVINQPQVAILGVGKVERRVCVVDTPDGEAIGVRTLCYLTLTIDHRAIDAFQANGFLEHVVKTLEQWSEA
jgi:2-oxoglutarate dehydrogenase E2 component (dihydrolipoamide succinyltransferase)